MAKHRAHHQSTEKGFTLIEVLIALVVVAVSLTALTVGLGNYVFQQAGLQERVVATWVAQNRLLEIQSTQDSDNATLDKIASENMLNADWQTEIATEKTLIPGLSKVTLTVKVNDSEQITTTLYSVVGK